MHAFSTFSYYLCLLHPPHSSRHTCLPATPSYVPPSLSNSLHHFLFPHFPSTLLPPHPFWSINIYLAPPLNAVCFPSHIHNTSFSLYPYLIPPPPLLFQSPAQHASFSPNLPTYTLQGTMWQGEVGWGRVSLVNSLEPAGRALSFILCGQSAGDLAPASDHMLVKLFLCLSSDLAAFLCLPLFPPEGFFAFAQIQSHVHSSRSSLCRLLKHFIYSYHI